MNGYSATACRPRPCQARNAHAADTPIDRAYRVGGALFAMCDSSIPGRHDGVLADETLDWLDAELTAAGGLPAFVCFHHPPVILGAHSTRESTDLRRALASVGGART